jgi:putative ABC transport system permease protein
MKSLKLYIENIKVAFGSIRANWLRSFLTIMIIAIGIMALIAILTAGDGLVFAMSDNFSKMGSNSFSIEPASQTIQSNKGGRVTRRAGPITFDEATEFYDRFEGQVAISMRATGSATIKYAKEKTNPTVSVYGVNNEYLQISKYNIEEGRGFSNTELQNANNRAIIGPDIVKDIFGGEATNAVNKNISIGNKKYKVVGVLESMGSSMNQNADRLVFIPLVNAKRIYGTDRTYYDLSVGVSNPEYIDDAVGQAIGMMRGIRRLKISEDNDFEIERSDGLMEKINDNTRSIRWSIAGIGLITLFGAAIGLMNIMLVSVTERTKEIGVRKALGASKFNIRLQFLTEAIVLCLIGGVIGIILGILGGNLVTYLLGSAFVIPYGWVLLGFSFCIFVGIAAGLYPAYKASNLDPIESLRYE